MKTQTTKTDPRDEEIAALRAQVAALAPRNQEQTAAYERRLAAAKHDERERQLIAMSDVERLAAFASAAVSEHPFYLRTIDSFCKGGVVHFYRLADDATKSAILAAHPNRATFEIAAEEESNLPRVVRIFSRVLFDYFQREAAGIQEPKPSFHVQTLDDPKEITESQAEQLRAVGISVRRYGKDDKPFFEGVKYDRDFLEVSKSAFDVLFRLDEIFASMVRDGQLVVVELNEQECRARLQLARDMSCVQS